MTDFDGIDVVRWWHRCDPSDKTFELAETFAFEALGVQFGLEGAVRRRNPELAVEVGEPMGCVSVDDRFAVLFEAADPATGLMHRCAWFVKMDGRRIMSIQECASVGWISET